MHRFAIRCAALLLGLSAPLEAQRVLPDRDTVALKQYPVAAGRAVRVHTIEGERLEGRLVQGSERPGGLWLRGRAGPVPLASVDSVWVGQSALSIGAVVGGLLLGLPSLLFLGALCEGLSEGTGCNEWGQVVLLSIPPAALGAGLGALIGRSSVRWRLRYVR